MLITFLENLLLGVAISAVPGAILFETMRRCVINRRGAMLFLAGNFSGMLIIVLASYVGISTLMTSTPASTLFYLISGGLLVYMGYSTIVSTTKSFKKTKNAKYSVDAGYVKGLILSLANPLSILFWVSLTPRFLHEKSSDYSAALNTLAVFIGAFVFFFAIIYVVQKLGQELTNQRMSQVSKLFGVIIVVFGLATLQNAFWALKVLM